MKRYAARRLLQMIPVLFIIIAIVFILMYVSGDPVVLMLPENATQEEIEALRAALNLDKPFYIQFVTFLWNALQGDFGESFRYGQPALSLVLERLPITMLLGVVSMFVAIGLALPLGILSATRKNSLLELFVTGGTVLGKAMPNFWVGIMLSLIFSVYLQWFPVSGSGTAAHLVLPAVTLGTSFAAYIARLTRSSMIEALQQDYVRTAKSKGLKGSVVVYKHAFRNALIPVVTIIMMQTGGVLGGALITEMIFAWPGLGQLLVQSINARDMSVVQAAIVVISLIVIVMNLITDLLCGWLDPRIKYR
ncbi:ABC transporter permease [Paenibacillus sp. J2TS4]|uniref:ABC transporter permease n=1 Tax=Paenibacillus sp. J2TS4 TaxID=2807194 RepID=UPI001B2CE558|nr:ABC transporter permease [Paenibacillus sp. J2TS4]GIP33432.1 glutathione ABC transporter permease [Paenibacillus sp. J2TS4]